MSKPPGLTSSISHASGWLCRKRARFYVVHV
jgi:hypothetical protein